MENTLVINMGLKSIRCIIFSKSGLKLGSAAQAINTAINNKCVEQNPAEWWEKAHNVIMKALVIAGNPKITYITVTTSASCLVCLDSEGNPLVHAFMVSDKRAEEEAVFISKLPEFEEVKRKTGLEVSASLMLPKILWVKNNMPEVYHKTAYFMSPNDYLIYMLCGAYVTDYFNAVKFHYILSESTYPMKLLDELQISVTKLPRVVNVGEKVGTIRPELAKSLRICNDTQIIITSYDAICSFVGSGVSEDGEASDVSGTVTVFRVFSKARKIKKSSKIYALPFYKDDVHIIGGSNNLGGGLIEWVKQCYYQHEIYPYEVMEKDAGESEIGARGLIFLPYLLGERAPLWDDLARGVFFGLERLHTRKDMTRAVFESTGFIDLDIMEAIQETGAVVDSVRLSGGLARINLVSQIKSDILGKDIIVLSEYETTAIGAAMMVLIGQGIYGNIKSVAEKFVGVRMIIKPNLENHKKYEYMYELYKETYGTLKNLFIKRAEILEQIRNDREVQIENL